MSNNKKLIEELDNDFVTLATEDAIEVKFVEADGQTFHRPDDDIHVLYEICEGYKPSSRDWIGLYSAGCSGQNEYLNFQWASRQPRVPFSPSIRGVLFPAGEVDIRPSTTTKYFFMYISKANQILAKSQKFYICDLDPERNLDLEFLENHYGDLEDFTLVQSRPETLQAASGTCVMKTSDHVSLTSDMAAGAGRTLVEIFGSSDDDDKALVPSSGSGPIVLYDARKNNKMSPLVETVETEERVGKEDTEGRDIDLEALRVELEFVDNNLNHQKTLVKDLSAQISKLKDENQGLSKTNDKLCQKLRDLTNRKETVEAEVSKCNSRIEELQTIVRLQKQGNKALELECRLAIEAAKKSENTAERLRSELNILEQQKTELEENFTQGLDINGNVVVRETQSLVGAEEAGDEEEGWSVATSRRTEQKQKKIEKLESSLSEEKEKCANLTCHLRECEHQIEQLRAKVQEHQGEQRKLVQQLCEEKNSSNELNNKVKDLSEELEKMREENERLNQEMAAVKRQKARVKLHLLERERELATRIQSLEDAVKAAQLISKRSKRQCDNFATQTCFKTVNSNTQTAPKRTADQASLTTRPEAPRDKVERKHNQWEDYFEQFKSAFWRDSEKPEKKREGRKQTSDSFQKPNFSFNDPLFPFPVFPLADNQELPANQVTIHAPMDLSISRSANEKQSPVNSSSSMATESEASVSTSKKSSGSLSQQEEEDEEGPMVARHSGMKLSKRQKKKLSARKTASYIVSKQPKPKAHPIQIQDPDVSSSSSPRPSASSAGSSGSGTRRGTDEPRRTAPRFVCHTRRLKFPGGAARNYHGNKGSRK